MDVATVLCSPSFQEFKRRWLVFRQAGSVKRCNVGAVSVVSGLRCDSFSIDKVKVPHIVTPMCTLFNEFSALRYHADAMTTGIRRHGWALASCLRANEPTSQSSGKELRACVEHVEEEGA